jgi:hypothetical protein
VEQAFQHVIGKVITQYLRRVEALPGIFTLQQRLNQVFGCFHDHSGMCLHADKSRGLSVFQLMRRHFDVM